MAQGPALGQGYYHAGYDNKPPGIFLLYQLTEAFDNAGLFRIRLLQGLMVLATCLLLLLWLRAEGASPAGWWAAAMYALLLGFTPGCRALTEPPMALFAAAALYLAYRGWRAGDGRYWLAAGFAVGVATCFKQVAVFEWAALMALALGMSPRGRRAVSWAAVALGFGLCWAAVLVWMAGSGQFSEFWESVFASFLAGGGAAPAGERLEGLLEYWRWIMPLTQVPLLTALLAFVGRPRRGLTTFLGVWLVAGALGTASSGYFLNHQSVQYFAPLAALSGLGGAWLRKQLRPLPRRGRALATLVLLILVFALPADKYRIRVQQEMAGYRQAGQSNAERLGIWLREYLRPEENLYVLGNGMPVYFYAQRRAPTRYFHSLLLTTPRLQEAALRDFQAHPPRVLVMAPDYYPAQREFTARVRAALLRRYARFIKYGPFEAGDPTFREYEVWEWNPRAGSP